MTAIYDFLSKVLFVWILIYNLKPSSQKNTKYGS